MQTNDFSNLPKSWQIKTLKSFGIFIRGVSYKKEQLLKEKTTNSVFLLRANNIQEKLDLTDLQIIPKELADGKIIQDNDIVFAMSSGSKHIVGKNIILSNLQDYSFGAFCGLFRITNKDLNSHYLAYFLQSDFYKKYIVKFAKGTNINNLRFNDLENLQIPLPPLETQKRIVARLESAFEKIEKGSAHLQDAKTKLTKYKQSLLKSAFNGTLTATASLQGVEKAETIHTTASLRANAAIYPAPSLRASVESVAIQSKNIDCHSPNGLRNDSIHSSLRGSGKATTKQSINLKIDCHESANADSRNDKESVDCHDLTSSKLAMTDKENPKLPQGWTIKTLGEVFKVVGGGTPSTAKTEFWNGNIAWITSADIDLQSFIITPKRFITNEAIQSSTTNCVKKDIIIVVTRVGLGKVGITDRQTCFSQDSQALIPLENINVKFMAFQIKNQAKNFISVSRGTTINGITKNTLKELKLVVPPLEIQKEIVKLLERHFECADKTDKFIESALNKAKQLKQSLLKSAFLGELTQ